MFQAIFTTHKLVVTLFLLIYLVKTFLLLGNNAAGLLKFNKMTKVPEMIISFLFLATGIYLLFQAPELGTLLYVKLAFVVASIPLAIVGFKKSNKVLVSVAMLLILGAYGLAEVNKKNLAKPSNGPISNNMDGAELYRGYCQKCHGTDGKLGMMGAKDLSASSLDDNGIKAIIANGKKTMPAFSKELNPEQIGELAKYTQTLRK